MRIVIFASGRGSNALNLIEKSKAVGFEVVGMIVDKPKAPILENQLVDTRLVPYKTGRDEHEMKILKELSTWDFDFICLCGYMRILSGNFVKKFSHDSLPSRIINIHPSALPLYPGLNSYERAFKDEVKDSGVTVHFVDEGVDTGEVIVQEKFLRKTGDSLEDFEKRGLELEHKIYPKALEKLREIL